MEPKQMLEAVIEKARKNGFSAKSLDSEIENDRITFCEDPYDIVVDQMYISTVEVLFNHDFAKAFYGYGKFHCCTGEGCAFMYHGWQYHLKEAVLSEDPLLYYYQRLT